MCETWTFRRQKNGAQKDGDPILLTGIILHCFCVKADRAGACGHIFPQSLLQKVKVDIDVPDFTERANFRGVLLKGRLTVRVPNEPSFSRNDYNIQCKESIRALFACCWMIQP